MLWLYIVLAIIALIAVVLLAAVVPRVTIELHLKNKILDILIKAPLFKKSLHFDLAQKPEKKEEPKEENPDGGFKKKLGDIKQRVFKPDTGFDMDEFKNVKTEMSESYREVLGILKTIFGKLRYKIHIPMFRVRLEYGTGDPADTGMVYGSIWSATGIIYPILVSYFNMEYPTLDITPDFYNKRFDIDIKSIIKVRPAHIINAAFVPAFTYFKDKIFKGSGKNG